MTATLSGTTSALQGLRQAVEDPYGPDSSLAGWRWAVRQQMAALRDALLAETGGAGEGALVARESTVLRQRNVLLARLSALGPTVLESPDIDRVRRDLHRLVADVGRYQQRVHDLAYDEVELELGGSE
jgi:hypothetical protein